MKELEVRQRFDAQWNSMKLGSKQKPEGGWNVPGSEDDWCLLCELPSFILSLKGLRKTARVKKVTMDRIRRDSGSLRQLNGRRVLGKEQAWKTILVEMGNMVEAQAPAPQDPLIDMMAAAEDRSSPSIPVDEIKLEWLEYIPRSTGRGPLSIKPMYPTGKVGYTRGMYKRRDWDYAVEYRVVFVEREPLNGVKSYVGFINGDPLGGVYRSVSGVGLALEKARDVPPTSCDGPRTFEIRTDEKDWAAITRASGKSLSRDEPGALDYVRECINRGHPMLIPTVQSRLKVEPELKVNVPAPLATAIDLGDGRWAVTRVIVAKDEAEALNAGV